MKATDLNMGFLVQSWIEGADRKLSPDFVVTPPLMKLGANKKNTLIISKVADLSESTVERIYWLNVRFIPPGKENSENTLNYSVTNQVKLIYRPKAIEDVDFNDEVKKIVWTVKGNQLIATNPTSHIINLNAIVVNSKPVEAVTHLLPQSDTYFKLNSNVSNPPKVDFEYINDYGVTITVYNDSQ